jgi:hypothetical protein
MFGYFDGMLTQFDHTFGSSGGFLPSDAEPSARKVGAPIASDHPLRLGPF